MADHPAARVGYVKAQVRDTILASEADLIRLSHQIHDHPELAFEETRAAAWLTDTLGESGFEVEANLCDMPTAFLARAGQGPLKVAICAEYDALPGIGHACGHNIIAAAAVGAGISLRPLADELGIEINVLGTPAEEDGGGKIRLLDGGAFEGVHAAIMVHPGPHDLLEPTVIGIDWIEAHYEGKPSHASVSPQAGINAADAVVIAYQAIGLLRQHIEPASRVHGIINEAGDAPNIIPAAAKATYMVRGTDLAQISALRERVVKCFEAGALATGCRLDFAPRRPPYAPMRHDARLTSLYRANAEAMGRRFADSDQAGREWAASTDMGNVSQAVPSAQPLIGIKSLPASNHQPEFAAASVSAAGDEAVLTGAITMAWTIADAATNAAVRASLIEDVRGS